MTPSSPETGRRRLAVVLLLAALTLAGGAWARLAARPAARHSAQATPLEFTAGAGGRVHLAGRLDRSRLLEGGDGLLHMELALSADGRGETPRVPTDLVVVFDRSGSMQGAPLANARAAVLRLVEELSPADRFALVSYASDARLDVPLAAASSSARVVWRERLAALAAGGGTNLSAGLDLASEQAVHEGGRAVRVVLLSDGHANEGDHRLEGLRARAARIVASERVLSAVGVGDGFNEVLMTTLADAGAGNFYYVRRGDDLGDVFAREFAAARSQVASGLRVVVEPAPGVEVLDAAGYPLGREGSAVAFRPGPLFAGQARRVWLTLRADPASVDGVAPVALRLHYRSEGEARQLVAAALPPLSVVADEAGFEAGIDRDAWAASIAEEGLGALQQAVSGALAAGRPAQARATVRRFVDRTRDRNARLQVPAVAEAIREAEAMEDALDAAPTAPARNGLSKAFRAKAYDKRRQGAKYGAPDGSK